MSLSLNARAARAVAVYAGDDAAELLSMLGLVDGDELVNLRENVSGRIARDGEKR